MKNKIYLFLILLIIPFNTFAYSNKIIPGGNTIGITTILVDQIARREFPRAKFRRLKEKSVQKKLRDKDLFVKGRYYV